MTLVWSPGYAPVDEYYDNVSLLLYGNGTNGSTTITDNSPSPKTVTAVGNAQISTAQSKFGGASLALDGSGDYVTTASVAAFGFGTGDFTIEAWVRCTNLSGGTGGTMQIIDFRASGIIELRPTLGINSNAFYYYANGGIRITSGTISANTWYHIAISRSGTSTKMFVDGTQAGSTYTDSNNYANSGPTIGEYLPGLGYAFQGYIDDLRITKVARYTSNFTPPTASFPDLSPTGRLTVAYTIDSDAAAYIAAVEAADGQALETATRTAIDSFVKGCKNDGIWNAIKASCILSGARTLAGALIPLVGTAPTNFNFVSGDYNRKTGLVGDGSTKYLNSNRNNNADPQNNKHLAVGITTAGNVVETTYIGQALATGSSHLSISASSLSKYSARVTGPGVANIGTTGTGFAGVNRSASTGFTIRSGNTTSGEIAATSAAPASGNILVFEGIAKSNPRLYFYSIGESLDLALLDTRVTSLINAFAAAIP